MNFLRVSYFILGLVMQSSEFKTNKVCLQSAEDWEYSTMHVMCLTQNTNNKLAHEFYVYFRYEIITLHKI